jgi:hypothetical protein
MNLQEFAARYQVKIKKDSCGDEIIPGKAHKALNAKRLEDHPHVWEHDRYGIAAYLTFPTRARWLSTQRRLEAIGTVRFVQTGDVEGIICFDPLNEVMTRLIFKIARVRVKRQLTDEQRAALRARFAKKEASEEE